MTYFVHDVMAELATALENHMEEDGHEFMLETHDASSGRGIIVVTSPDGSAKRFSVRITEGGGEHGAP